jgi:hypothetical protein
MFSIKKYLPIIVNYFRCNPQALFIVGFQIFFLGSAGLLSVGNSFWAERVAIFAYFSLMVGVILQLISFIRNKEIKVEENDGKT